MEILAAAVFGKGAAERGMADDEIIERGFEGGRVERPVETDDVGFVERAVRVVAHLDGVENLALRRGGRRVVEARKCHGSLANSLGGSW